jgi:predicted CXXCH cytochrome family protein
MIVLPVLGLTMALAQEAPLFYAPLDQSLIPVGVFRVVAHSAGDTKLLLDGKPVAFEAPAPGVIRADVKLGAGAHELVARNAAGESKLAIFAGKAQAGFQPFKQHPPLASCDTCHALKQNQWAMKRASLAPVCAACHPQDRFPVVHTHGADLLAECQACHMPHGSQAAKLLKQPKEIGCKQCHGQP